MVFIKHLFSAVTFYIGPGILIMESVLQSWQEGLLVVFSSIWNWFTIYPWFQLTINIVLPSLEVILITELGREASSISQPSGSKWTSQILTYVLFISHDYDITSMPILRLKTRIPDDFVILITANIRIVAEAEITGETLINSSLEIKCN